VTDTDALRSRIRTWTGLFMVGLVLSGVTAIPIATEVAAGKRLLGDDFAAGGKVPPAVAAWLRTVARAVETTEAHSPLLFYGTDWLAFGHIAIALAFVGALRDPVRNRWLYRFGMMACALVPVWALVFGHIRGIPVWWRVIDSAFGIGGFIPLWLCDRWVSRLEGS
jgi:hypothetical protein